MKQIPRVIFLLGLLSAGPAFSAADAPEPAEAKNPKIALKAGTQDDGKAALTLLKSFLDSWENRDYSKALELVDDRVRKSMKNELVKRSIKLKSIDDIRLQKRSGQLWARVHISVAPNPRRKDRVKQGIGIDMIFRKEKWWITAR